MIASVAVSAAVYAIDKPYSYRIPDEYAVEPGMRVLIPFGRGNRRCEGVVLSVSAEESKGLKAITAVLDEQPVLTQEFLRMAAFVRERYFCTFYDAIKAMLPAGLWMQTEEAWELTDAQMDWSVLEDTDSVAVQILRMAVNRGGKVETTALRTAFPEADTLNQALNVLQQGGFLRPTVEFSQKVHDKTEKIATLAVSAEETMEFALRKKRSAPLQYEVLKLLCSIGSGSTKEICYLTGATMATIRRLESLGYVKLSMRPVFRNSLPTAVKAAEPLVLNDRQQAVYQSLSEQALREKPGVSLLYGVTGSGKTAVYLKLIHDVLSNGQSAIFLVPEIALTPQLVQVLMSHFGQEVAVLHSALRVSERYDEWKRIRQGKARVVLGTRSAIFAPVQNLGLILVDEEQEHSYKSENAPRYHAREVAIYRGSKSGALVVLGSATPSLESMYLAKEGIYTLHTLPDRYNGRGLPSVELVDLKQELKIGNFGAISLPLRRALADNIAAGRQSILFLNRRGASRCMICVDCGEVPMCPRCSVSLTYHTANGRLMCHHCGFSQPVPAHCPQCGGSMKTMGIGTQRIEQELQQLFPNTEILRMDADTISASNNHEAMLEKFRKQNIPILLGTQMVTKGLNFENVTLVGVLDADMSLYVDHYRAAETTFSMLTQVIGRAGRGENSGRAIIQTMTPEHSVIQLAARQDYDGFYDLDITLRQLQKAPPWSDIFTITFVGPFEDQTIAAAGIYRQMLERSFCEPPYQQLQVGILGPSPAAVSKVNNTYRYRIMVRCPNSRSIRQLLAYLMQQFAKDKRSKGVTVFADINAYE